MLSIVIPCFNSFESLNRILESLQCIRNRIQVIVVDDCSTEPVCDLKSNFLWVDFYRLEENSGAGAARNYGLARVQKPFVSFIDADDTIDVDILSQAIDSLKDEIADIQFYMPTSHTSCGDKGRRHERYSELISSYLSGSDTESIKYKFHVPWSKIYRVSMLNANDINFDETLASNDVIFSLKSALSANIINVNDKGFYSVFENDSGLTGSDSVEKLKDRLKVLIRYNRYIRRGYNEHYQISAIPLIYRALKLGPSNFLKIVRNNNLSFFIDVLPKRSSVISLYRSALRVIKKKG